MATQNLTEAEIFQHFLAAQVATAARSKSPEELLRLWRQRQQEVAEAVEALDGGISDMNEGRVYPFAEVNNAIRRKQGWTPME